MYMGKAAGYSGTPLAKKLGIKEGSVLSVVHQPDYYFSLFADFPDDVQIIHDERIRKDLIHYFARSLKEYMHDINGLKNQIKSSGCIWVSWPKKSSKIATDVSEDMVRNIALKNGLVDIKVCAVDEIWSGLKLVIPIKKRI